MTAQSNVASTANRYSRTSIVLVGDAALAEQRHVSYRRQRQLCARGVVLAERLAWQLGQEP